jgi:hypothetical protein
MSSTSPVLPEKWAKVLNRVEHMLEETLVAASGRMLALDDLFDAGEVAHARTTELARITEFLDGLDRRLEAASVAAAQTDLILAGGEKLLRDYLARGEELQQSLATWNDRAIG